MTKTFGILLCSYENKNKNVGIISLKKMWVLLG